MIEFHGVRSTALRVFVEHYPQRPIPKRRVERFTVPGRSGDVIAVEDAFENTIQRYDIYLSGEAAGLPLVAAAAAQWLCVPGYQRLEDEYDRDTFRLAQFIGPVDLENLLNEFGRATIEFDCMPQRFLKSGAQALTLTNGATLNNPTGFAAEPLITVHGAGAGTLTVGSATLTLTDCGELALDCREEEAYRLTGGAAFNLNSTVIGKYPRLGAGATAFSWSGGVTGVTVIPRWWTP